MNRSVFLVFVLVYLTTSCAINIHQAKASTDTWVIKAPMPTARFAFGAVAVNDLIYAIGGILVLPNGAETTTNINEAYDPASNSWVERAPMPSPNWLDSFGIAAYQNKIYCIGGPANNVYDPSTDTWEAKTPMPTPRHFLNANVVEGKIYLIGGRVFANYYYSLSAVNEVYDPATDSWTEKAPMPNAVASYASAVVNNKIYVISGSSSSDITDLVQVYDPQTDKWSEASPIPIPVENAAADAIGNNATANAIYVVGGSTASDRTLSQNYNQVYFPQNDSWSMSSPMITSKAALSVVVVNYTLYAMGGTNWGEPDPILSSTYQYLSNDYVAPNSTSSPSPSPTPNMSPSLSPSPRISPSLTQSPSVPEFPSWIILPMLVTGTVLIAALRRNRRPVSYLLPI